MIQSFLQNLKRLKICHGNNTQNDLLQSRLVIEQPFKTVTGEPATIVESRKGHVRFQKANFTILRHVDCPTLFTTEEEALVNQCKPYRKMS